LSCMQISHSTRVNTPCHTRECVMCISHATHVNESWHVHEAHTWTREWGTHMDTFMRHNTH